MTLSSTDIYDWNLKCDLCKQYYKKSESIKCEGYDCKDTIYLLACPECKYCSFECRADIKLVEEEIERIERGHRAIIRYLQRILDDIKERAKIAE